MTYINSKKRKNNAKKNPNILISFLLIIAISFVVEFFFPWYLIGLISFVICFLNIRKPGLAFLISFFAIFILWIGRALYADLFFDLSMSILLGNIFGGVSTSAIFFLTGLIGGIVGGFSGLSGSLLRNILLDNE